jgi:hypothetical protein
MAQISAFVYLNIKLSAQKQQSIAIFGHLPKNVQDFS